MRCRLNLVVLLGIVTFCCASVRAEDTARPPNIVLIVADDMGWGDLSCYGSQLNSTPALDRLAESGVKLTSFYVAQPVCSASRTAILTGCYANRLGLHGALGPQAKHGINAAETTLAEVLHERGYATQAIGKWHLGHLPPFLPTRNGFDHYFGLPYSNDMWPYHPELKPNSFPPLPLFSDEQIVDDNITADDQKELPRRYTETAVEFIHAKHEQPFFLYVAYAMPHVPLFTGREFDGKTMQGLYADVLAEIDWSVGEMVGALKQHGIEQNTLVIFTSDNGPWLSYGNHAGSAGPWREGKGTVFEGGVRVPCIVNWPGHVQAGTVQNEPAMTIDLLPTIARLTGGHLPEHKIDGTDVWPILQGDPQARNPHECYYFYYGQNELQALRSGQWKLHFPHTARTMLDQIPGKDGIPGKYRALKVGLELYDLATDPGETKNVANDQPDVLARLQGLAEQAREDLGDQLQKREGAGYRPPGRVE